MSRRIARAHTSRCRRDREQRGDLTREHIAKGPHSRVVAASLAGQRPAAIVERAIVERGVRLNAGGVGLGGVFGSLELSVGGVGLGRPLGGLDPEDLEVGERRAELLLREGVALLQLAQDGADFVAQPALLGVGTQEQADVRWGRWIGIVGHASIRARQGSTCDRRPAFGFGARTSRL